MDKSVQRNNDIQTIWIDHTSFFYLRTLSRAVSLSPTDLTKPQMVTTVDFPRLTVPSSLSSQILSWTEALSFGVMILSV